MLDALSHPIIQAPMAGGASTPELAAAVSTAGGLGFLAGGLLTADALAAQLAEVRRRTRQPFGVNLFHPSAVPADPRAVGAYAERLQGMAQAAGVELGTPRYDRDHYDEKLALLEAEPPEVVSFVFGCPERSTIARLQAAGAEVWLTATQLAEARAADAAGADGVIVQGAQAGGHRGGWDDADGLQPVPLLALLEAVRDALPEARLIAAGGLMSGADIAGAMAAGADAAQLGTAFMLAPEAGTSAPHRRAIASDRPTAITRAFSGRRGRSIVNRWMTEVGESAPVAYPELVHLTSPLRAYGASAGDEDLINLWAGIGHADARALPAADLVLELSAELSAVGGG